MTTVALLALFVSTTQTYGLPPGLLSAVCWTESNHKTKVVNHHDGLLRAGVRAYDPSIGMCQVKVSTARQFEPHMTAERLLSPKVNARIAAKYLQWQISRYEGDILCGVASYNAGSCRFNTHGKIKNRKYLDRVFKSWIDNR